MGEDRLDRQGFPWHGQDFYPGTDDPESKRHHGILETVFCVDKLSPSFTSHASNFVQHHELRHQSSSFLLTFPCKSHQGDFCLVEQYSVKTKWCLSLIRHTSFFLKQHTFRPSPISLILTFPCKFHQENFCVTAVCLGRNKNRGIETVFWIYKLFHIYDISLCLILWLTTAWIFISISFSK